ncbi:MAG TPA: ABC transporter permease [Vicinamibacterales bacterium]|nr:ABC transporter permease [Vicinamibacterales bacterium]
MRRIARWFGGKDEDLALEIQQHLDELTEALVESGVPREEAAAAARRQFGNVTSIAERAGDVWVAAWLAGALGDARSSTRQLRRNPLLAAACVMTLALGIGANAAIFSTVDAVLLRPLPFTDPGRLVLVTEYSPDGVSKTGSPLGRYVARAEQNRVFSESAAYWNVSGSNGLVFGGATSAERLQFSMVTNSFFGVLGVEPASGRTFLPSEERAGGANVFVASDALWRRLLGADPHAIGRTFLLDGEPYTLTGVMPAGFSFPVGCDVWVPLGATAAAMGDRVSHQYWMIGRLRPGLRVADAQADLDALQRRFAAAYPATDANWLPRVQPLLDEFVGGVRTALWVLFAAVGFVLLIACTNVMNLLLARAVAREKEFAVRAALGAGRGRLIRQTFAETLLLVALGTAAALVVASWALHGLAVLGAGSLPRFDHVRLDATVVLYAIATALAAALLVGLVPALHATGTRVHDALQRGHRMANVSSRTTTLRNALVIAEVAFTLVLLAGAGLMLRSFVRLRQVDPGFEAAGVVTVRIALPDAGYPRLDQRTAFLARLLDRLHATPGVLAAGATDRLPLSGERNWGRINIEGRPVLDAAHAPSVEGRGVSAAYFRTLGMPILRGRTFSDADIAARRPVVVINQAMAERFWPGADPIGRRLVSVYHPARPLEVIGVVGNVKDFALDEDSPAEMYSPYGWWNTMNLVLRGGLDAAGLAAAVRREVATIDPEVPVYGLTTMSGLVAHSLGRQRFELWLFGLFAAMGVALAAIGLYGVLAFSVGSRTHEIGVRLALGAERGRVLRLVIGQGLTLVLLGLAIGTAGSMALTRVMAVLLYRVSPADPLTFAAVSAVLLLVGAAASAVPAIRATQVDPVVALRSD